MVKSVSRGPDIDTDLCVENSGGNRFSLVIMAAARSREIKRQHKESDKFEHIHSNVTALLEFQEGKYDAEYIKRIKFDTPRDRAIDRRAQYK
jgi:DNA-directed RNA polymerase subunit K/omega